MILNVHLERDTTKRNAGYTPKQGSIHGARDGIVEHVWQDAFSIMDQTSALSEVCQNNAGINEGTER